MFISGVNLSRFRNFEKQSFTFSPDTTIISGPNGSGKTNILESIFLLATGKSFKAKIEEEMISYDCEIARIEGWVKGYELGSEDEEKKKLEIVLTKGELRVGEDPVKIEKVPRKRLLLNGAGKRVVDFAGNLRVVLFGPWDMDLVSESPSIRRKFLDTVLSQTDREYRRAILSYEKGLRQRNRLLYRIREEGLSRSQLLFWDKLLIKNGDYISNSREEFVNFVNQTPQLNDEDLALLYDKSAISESRLEQYASEEVAAGTTLVGPHRDDFVFKGEGRELASYGSRGEARMGVLWLKLAELTFIKEKTEEEPVMLLDDIFSELDEGHRKIVVEVIKNRQSIITTADPHFDVFKDVDKIAL